MLLILLLISPELSEVGLPGGFSLKRRIEAQQARIETQQERQELLEQRLTAVQQQAAIAGSRAEASVIISPEAVLAALQPKTAEFAIERGLPPEPPKPRLAAGSTDVKPGEPREGLEGAVERAQLFERERLEAELLRLWRVLGSRVRQADELDAYLDGQSVPPEVAERLDRLDPEAAAQLIRWRDLFREETGVVKAARNSLMHRAPIDTRDLAAAVEIASRLVEVIPAESGESADKP